MYFESVEARMIACENEKKGYVELLEFIQPMKEVAREFDGKVINVRFKDKLSERLAHYVDISFGTSVFSIKVYSNVLHESHSYNIDLSAFDKTESGKYRLNAERFGEYIDTVCAEQLKNRISLYNVDDIVEARSEFKKITESFNAFKKKYSSKVIEYAGCDFRLADCYMGDYSLI